MEIVNLKHLLDNVFGTPKYATSVRCLYMTSVSVSVLAADTIRNTDMTSMSLFVGNTNRLTYKPCGLPQFSIRMSTEQI